jgi:hypothetical protein
MIYMHSLGLSTSGKRLTFRELHSKQNNPGTSDLKEVTVISEGVTVETDDTKLARRWPTVFYLICIICYTQTQPHEK